MRKILILAVLVTVQLMQLKPATAAVNKAFVETTDGKVISMSPIDHLTSFLIPVDLNVKVMTLSSLINEPPNALIAFFLNNRKQFEDLEELHFENGIHEDGAIAIFTLKKYLEKEIRILGKFENVEVLDRDDEPVHSSRFTFRKNTIKIDSTNYFIFHRSISDFNKFQPSYDVGAILKKYEVGPWI